MANAGRDLGGTHFQEEKRMTIRRPMLALLLMLGLMAGTVATSFAQDSATPEAGTTDKSTTGDVVDNVAIEVVDESGKPALAITVNETVDPFEDFDEYSTPDRGLRLVSLEVTIENIGSRSTEVSPYDFFIRDEQGFIYASSYVSRTDESVSAVPDFETTELAEGDSVTGMLVFEVPTEATGVDAFYAPSGRLITIATLGGDAINEQ
jgi:hypothetical protein